MVLFFLCKEDNRVVHWEATKPERVSHHRSCVSETANGKRQIWFTCEFTGSESEQRREQQPIVAQRSVWRISQWARSVVSGTS